jgi:hypothetical protein
MFDRAPHARRRHGVSDFGIVGLSGAWDLDFGIFPILPDRVVYSYAVEMLLVRREVRSYVALY